MKNRSNSFSVGRSLSELNSLPRTFPCGQNTMGPAENSWHHSVWITWWVFWAVSPLTSPLRRPMRYPKIQSYFWISNYFGGDCLDGLLRAVHDISFLLIGIWQGWEKNSLSWRWRCGHDFPFTSQRKDLVFLNWFCPRIVANPDE
jgi:hypothetical protein